MNIVFYGGHYWKKDAWFRKQQFASRLAERGHTIFYIEESVSIIRRKKGAQNPLFLTKFEKINENLHLITPSAYLPFPNNYFARKIYNLKLLYEVKRYLKQQSIDNFIFWFNKLDISSVLTRIKEFKIFDLCDDLPYYQKLFGNEKGYLLQDKYLKNAFGESNSSIVSAVRLREKYQKYSGTEILVEPNGHNLSLDKLEQIILPDDIKKIGSPRIGFIGTLFKFLDVKLLEYLIVSRPNYNFIFVGGIESTFPIDKFAKFNNFHHLGMKNKELIDSYIRSFDICLNPFSNHEVNESVNPVKVFEYLANNKKVLSTNMYSLMKEQISKYIIFAETHAEYLEKLDSLVDKSDYSIEVPKDIIENYSWDNIFKSLINKLNKEHKLNL